MKDNNHSPDLLGQHAIKLISNVGFSIFIFSVLTFTIIAITYQPPDPWESSRALIKDLTQLSNATFQIDTSLIKTGEDIDSVSINPSASPAYAPVSVAPLITNTASDGCDDSKLVNCSAPGVLTAVKKFNSKHFKSIVFVGYQKPVNGSGQNECDVSWRFRNKKDKSWRKYRDFRRFKFGYSENCTYKIVRAKGWHSGVNAKSQPKSKTVTTFEINDTILSGSGLDIRNGKYLYYSRGGDYCKSMNQYIWSLLCALGEARYLNRTFVMDLSVCLSSKHASSNRDEEGKDFRFYFDYERLKETALVVEEHEFVKKWKKFEKRYKKKVPVRKIESYKVAPVELKNETSAIIWRRFDKPEPENYWYRVCENQAGNYINRPWHSLWKSKRIMNIVSEISGKMDWDFDGVHVIRGEKAQNKAMWPHLNEDTSPESLVSKLQGVVKPWRNLYIATNEPFYNYFDRLRSYYKVHLLDDYKDLWGNKSEWYNETMSLNGGRPVEFDGYMRAEVDTEVLYRAKTRVETFYNLTNDCKDGVNSC